MKVTNFEFVPTSSNYEIKETAENSAAPFEPEYKKKEKTEMCKTWARGLNCPFGDKCAFAHGEEQLVKKTHVAKQFRMTLCKSYA
jgi:hypothetical protein